MYVVVVELRDDGEAMAETYGPFDNKRAALAFARRDCKEMLKDYVENDIMPSGHEMSENYDHVGFEGGPTWMVQKVMKARKAKRCGVR